MDIRRFEIIPILDRIQVGDKATFQITCAEVVNEDIYLGTIESFIFLYKNALRLGDPVLPKPSYKFLSSKKPILQLKIISALGQLLCLTDQTLNVLNLETLETINNIKSKNVYAFCLNESPITDNPFSVEICLVKRKTLQICELEEDKLKILKEITLPEQSLSVSMDGYFICSASECNYYMINWSNSNCQLVLGNDHSETHTKSMIRHVARDEFLINGLSLGIFIKTSGISDKPPIDWGTDVLNYIHYHPFILCLKRHSICVISVIDSLVKEEFQIEGGVFIDNFDGKILIASRDCVYFLRRIPFQEQIESLLKSSRTTEAIDLCANLHESGLIGGGQEEYSRSVMIKAGLIELERKNFDQAKDYLIDCYFDIRILLNCIEDISKYLSFTIDNKFDSIYLQRLITKIKESPEEYREFFVTFLNEIIKNGSFLDIIEQLNTALIFVYLQDKEKYTKDIQKYLWSLRIRLNYDILLKYFEDNDLYHYKALLLSRNDENYEQTIDIWKKLEKHEINDNYYDGLKNFYEIFNRSKSSKLILKHVEFILERDQFEGAKILISNTIYDNDRYSLLDPDFVVSLLHRYRQALIVYLEHLVFVLAVKNSNVHSSLAILYIEMIAILRESEEDDRETVRKLNNLLHTSIHYDTNTVLRTLVQRGHDYEAAYLYGKLGNHRKAFEIYLIKHSNHHEALKHCLLFYNSKYPTKITSELFDLYVELYNRNGPELVEKPFLEFLNHSKCTFDIHKVLNGIPHEWPLVWIKRFIECSMRKASNDKFFTSFGKVLSISMIEPKKRDKQSLLRKSICVDDESICINCNRPLAGNNIENKIEEQKFVWIPSLECCLHESCHRKVMSSSRVSSVTGNTSLRN